MQQNMWESGALTGLSVISKIIGIMIMALRTWDDDYDIDNKGNFWRREED